MLTKTIYWSLFANDSPIIQSLVYFVAGCPPMDAVLTLVMVVSVYSDTSLTNNPYKYCLNTTFNLPSR